MTQNSIQSTFSELHAEFGANGHSERADVLCADLAAKVAQEPHATLVGIFELKTLRKIYGLVYTLSEYGVSLRSKRRSDGNTFVFAEVELPTPVQFTGAFVKARRVGAAA